MNSPEIIKCIQIIQKKPKWFFQQNDIAEKLACFDIIRKIGTPSAIYALTDFLKSDNVAIRQKSAETILHLYSQVKFQKSYNDSLKHLQIDIKDLSGYRVNLSEDIYLQLVHIASLNSDGYTREFAVGEIIRLNKSESLKFLLFRLSDWVVQVREIATAGINFFLKIEFSDQFIRELPTIDALLRVKRVDLRSVHTRIITFILSEELSREFWVKLNQFDDRVRLLYLKHYLSNRKPAEETIKKISNDRNFMVRLEIIRFLPQYDRSFQLELVEKLLTDPSARIRINALYQTKSFNRELDRKIFNLLSDESAAVRELSRKLLKLQHFELADIYIERINKKEFLSGSLSGLAELDAKMDYLPVFEQHIKDKSSAIVLASLTGINKVNSEKGKQYAIDLLKHSGSRVRFKAAELLVKNHDIISLEKIKVIYAESDVDTEKIILRLYSHIGGWKIIGELLKALTDQNNEIQDIAWQMLLKWKMKATQLFTIPAKGEIDRALFIYNNLDKSKMQLTKSREKLLEDLPFYLK